MAWERKLVCTVRVRDEQNMTLPGELVPNKKVHQAVAETAIKQGVAPADHVPYVEE
jgi:hypothetical protein